MCGTQVMRGNGSSGSRGLYLGLVLTVFLSAVVRHLLQNVQGGFFAKRCRQMYDEVPEVGPPQGRKPFIGCRRGVARSEERQNAVNLVQVFAREAGSHTHT